jgi:magnesium chelatase family protein
VANGLPSFTLVGLVDTEVKVARERVPAALAQSGLGLPSNKRITDNLAPADLPTWRDLAGLRRRARP